MPDTPQPRRPQFSLLNLLFLGTAVAAVAGLYGSWQTIRQQKADHAAREAELQAGLATIREENAKLRAEQGALTIEDPEKVYAIRLPELFNDVWRYRVYLPPGRDYYFAAQANGLPRGEEPVRFGGGPPDTRTMSTGQASSGAFQHGMGVSAGEYLVALRLFTNDDGDKAYSLRVDATGENKQGRRSGSSGSAIRSEPDEWPAIEKVDPANDEMPRGFFLGGQPAGRQSQRCIQLLPLVLHDYRVLHGKVQSSADSDEGLIVWVGRADEKP